MSATHIVFNNRVSMFEKHVSRVRAISRYVCIFPEHAQALADIRFNRPRGHPVTDAKQLIHAGDYKK